MRRAASASVRSASSQASLARRLPVGGSSRNRRSRSLARARVSARTGAAASSWIMRGTSAWASASSALVCPAARGPVQAASRDSNSRSDPRTWMPA